MAIHRVLHLLSATLIGLSVWLGTALLPVRRLGELDLTDRAGLTLVAALLWVGLLAWLSATLRRSDAQHLLRRAAFAACLLSILFLLPLASWNLSRILWRSRYLLGLYTVVSGLAVTAFVFREELTRFVARRSWRATTTIRSLVIGAGLVVLLGESILDGAAFWELRYVPDHATVLELTGNYVLNVALVAASIGVVAALTDRFVLAASTVGASYLALVGCNAFKLLNLKDPVRALDVFTLGEMGTVLRDFLPLSLLVLAAIGALPLFFLALWWSLQRRRPETSSRERLSLSCASLFVLLLLCQVAALRPEDRNRWLFWQDEHRWDARQASLGLGFLFHLLEDGLAADVPRPDDYTSAEIAALHERAARSASSTGSPSCDVVILMVESLTDPGRFGIELTEDPLPFFHELARESSSGRAVSPAFGGRSANPEFEVLTGLSLSFLPRGSLPHAQYVRHDLPALPRLLRDRGYRTVAVIADPSSYYNRLGCYPKLGFDEIVWLHEDWDVEREETGRFPSDDAVVEAILEVTRSSEPTFVFAFTNASHAPFDRARYPDSTLDVVGPQETKVAVELGGYANALRQSDRAIERLVDETRARGKDTVITVLGDHLPPFRGPDGVYDVSRYFEGPPLEVLARKHSVPVVVWASFEAPRRDISCSTSFLGLEILRTMGMEPGRFFSALDSVYAEVPVVASFLQTPDGKRLGRRHVPSPVAKALSSYRLLQYDVLFAKEPAADWFE